MQCFLRYRGRIFTILLFCFLPQVSGLKWETQIQALNLQQGWKTCLEIYCVEAHRWVDQSFMESVSAPVKWGWILRITKRYKFPLDFFSRIQCSDITISGSCMASESKWDVIIIPQSLLVSTVCTERHPHVLETAHIKIIIFCVFPLCSIKSALILLRTKISTTHNTQFSTCSWKKLVAKKSVYHLSYQAHDGWWHH